MTDANNPTKPAQPAQSTRAQKAAARQAKLYHEVTVESTRQILKLTADLSVRDDDSPREAAYRAAVEEDLIKLFLRGGEFRVLLSRLAAVVKGYSSLTSQNADLHKKLTQLTAEYEAYKRGVQDASGAASTPHIQRIHPYDPRYRQWYSQPRCRQGCQQDCQQDGEQDCSRRCKCCNRRF